MTAPTASTASAVECALLDNLADVVDGAVGLHRAWPGTDAARRMIFVTETTWESSEIATVNDGRRRRDETYNLGFEVRVHGEGSPKNAGAAKDAALTLFGHIEDVCARQVGIGTSRWPLDVEGVARCVPQADSLQVVAFESGWAAVLTGAVNVRARLA